MNGRWVPQATRDLIVHFIRHWARRTGLSVLLLIGWLAIAPSKFNRWSRRLGTPNQHNATVPRDFWLDDWEKAAIIDFYALYPSEGYRRLTYMMLDADVVAVSPSSVYRVLKAAGKLLPRWGKFSKKGKGFEQPVGPHEHWHILLSSEQWEDGAVVQNPENRLHPRQDPVELGRRSTARCRVRGLLQHGPIAQRNRLRHSGGQVGRSR